MQDMGGLSILDAIDNLHTVVEAEALDDIGIAKNGLFFSSNDPQGEDLSLGPAKVDERTLKALQATLKSIYSYLQTYYFKMSEGGDQKKLMEGVNTVMVLVGEATKKLEKFDKVFKKHICNFDVYKQLQHFYYNRVIKETFQSFAQTPVEQANIAPGVSEEHQAADSEIQSLLKEGIVETEGGVHILDDIEVVSKDTDYELFYLLNEQGYKFYTLELANKILKACNLSDFTDVYFGDDPLLQIKNWDDKNLHLRAKNLLEVCRRPINDFYRTAPSFKEVAVIKTLRSSIMALMLAANPRNLIRQFAPKGCHLYFQDFLLFLRQALLSKEYQQFLIYGETSHPVYQHVVDVINLFCYHLYTTISHDEEIEKSLQEMTHTDAPHKGKSLAPLVERAYQSISTALEKHPHGPLFKAADLVLEKEELFVGFDPLHQGNLPSHEWSATYDSHPLAYLRIPCPTQQEMIDKAYITEEFKSFLRTLKPEDHLLLVNFQDRTSWKEHARSLAIEELAKHVEFTQGLTVVTLTQDTDFYKQQGAYEDLHQSSLFIDHFLQHLYDEITGYYFSPKLRKELFPRFMEALLQQIHKTFFSGKKHLDRLDRLDFIRVAHHFIELKLIELVQPTYLAFISKDAADVEGETSIGFIGLVMDNQKQWSQEERKHLITLLFGPTLMLRERVIHKESFERTHALLKRLEAHQHYLDDFSHLYYQGSLEWTISL